jgi:hypothetical protein
MTLPAIEQRQGELALSALPYPSVVSLVYLTNGKVAWSIIGGTRLPSMYWNGYYSPPPGWWIVGSSYGLKGARILDA